jgi:hypothetical protein
MTEPPSSTSSSASGLSHDLPALLGQRGMPVVRREMLAYEVARLEVAEAYLMRHRRLGQMTGWGWASYGLFFAAVMGLPVLPVATLLCFVVATACSLVDQQRRSFNRFVGADIRLGAAIKHALDREAMTSGFGTLPRRDQVQRLAAALEPLATSREPAAGQV